MKNRVLSQEEVWSKIAPQWKELRSKPMQEVADFLKGKTGNLLDLGCGSGRHFSLFKGSIYGVDFSDKMLKLAEETAKEDKIKVILKKASADKIPFEDNFFDYAIYIAALHCIDSAKKRESSLKELFRVMKPKAQALISVWSRQHRAVKNKSKEFYLSWRKLKVKRYYYLYEKKELILLLRKTGFKISEVWEGENIWAIVSKP